jgi:hypothetical protein
MKYPLRLAALASVSFLALSSGASAFTVTTPYNPGDPTDLSQFENGNELAAQTVTNIADPNGKGFDVTIQVDPAGSGGDMADNSLGDQFSNYYFGNNAQGATIGFSLSANGGYSFVPGEPGSTPIGSSAGIKFVDTPGTTYANGGVGSMSTVYFPYADFTSNVLGLPGFTPYNVGDPIQLRDIQAFSYGGNNAGGGLRFGSDVLLAGVPEPATWAMMFGGMFGAGAILRRSRSQQVLLT